MPIMPTTPVPRNRLAAFFRYHLPLILYGGLILFVSSIPNLHPPRVSWLPFDKVAHFLEYAVFAFLAYRSLSKALGEDILANAALRTPIDRPF